MRCEELDRPALSRTALWW